MERFGRSQRLQGCRAQEQLAIAKVVSDVWLAGVVQWVTGRATAEEVTTSLDTTVRLLLRP